MSHEPYRLSIEYIEECVKHHQAAQPKDFYTQVLTKLLDTMRENERLRVFLTDFRELEAIREYGLETEIDEALSNKDSDNAD